jgi:ArsR family transcriptional regulator
VRAFVEVAKALADEGRVRILLALRGRELCVCEITELLELAPSTVSKHMSILRHANLVVGRKDGRWVYYRLATAEKTPEARFALEWIGKSLLEDGAALNDAARVEEILKDRVCACETEPLRRAAETAARPRRRPHAERQGAAD